MRTITPKNGTAALSILSSLELEQERAMLQDDSHLMEIPLQQMFDEFIVFISKKDFE